MQATYTKNGEEQEILEQEEVLLEKQTETISSNKISISENIKLDLKDKNDLLNDFKQKMGMSISADYMVTLKVNVKTKIEEKDIVSQYNSTVRLDLAEKTTQILGENNKDDIQYISKEYEQITKSPFMVILDVIVIAFSIYLLRFVSKAKVTNRVKNEYKQELNRILKLCQDKIVQVSTKPEKNMESAVYVKDFAEVELNFS